MVVDVGWTAAVAFDAVFWAPSEFEAVMRMRVRAPTSPAVSV